MPPETKQELVPVAVTLPTELLVEIDSRIRELDLNRSQYFRKLVRADLQAKGEVEKSLRGAAERAEVVA